MPRESSQATIEPTYTFLAKLVPSSSLLQEISLKKAVRMWVIINTFRNANDISLPIRFQKWYRWAIQNQGLEDRFGKPHQKISLADLIFEAGHTPKSQWFQTYQKQSNLSIDDVKQQLRACPYQVSKNRSVAPASYERFLRNDFYALVDLGILQQHSRTKQYSLNESTLQTFIHVGSSKMSPVWSAERIMTLELANILSSYRSPIRGVQRLFMDLDYVVSETGGDQVNMLQIFLYEQIWTQDPVPLMQFDYASKLLNRTINILTYPIALYYSKRAPYLCGWGQSLISKPNEPGFYNFRMDQIFDPKVVPWSTINHKQQVFLSTLLQQHRSKTLPEPEVINEMMEIEAWGFDIGFPASPLLLRFDRHFHDIYIEESDRHETFKPLHNKNKMLSQHKLQQFFKKHNIPTADQSRLQKHFSRYPNDAFYSAIFREGDNNIVMRLRAWGPKVEVLYPFSLQERMIKDLQEAIAMYEVNRCHS